MSVVDITKWDQLDKLQVSGTREKFWVQDPKGKKWLFKIPRKDTGEAWAEKVASDLGKGLGFCIADIKIATFNKIIGTITPNFRAEHEEFFEGGDLLLSKISNFKRYDLKYYELDSILEALKEFDLDRDFVFVPFFDALIGNQDRHCDNWGIIRTRNTVRLAPLYDNGSSLGFNLSTERIKLLLRDQNAFYGFTRRARTIIGLPGRKKPKCIEVLSRLQELYPKEVQKVMEQINTLGYFHIERSLGQLPQELISEIHYEWLTSFLEYRKNWLNDNLKGG